MRAPTDYTSELAWTDLERAGIHEGGYYGAALLTGSGTRQVSDRYGRIWTRFRDPRTGALTDDWETNLIPVEGSVEDGDVTFRDWHEEAITIEMLDVHGPVDQVLGGLR